MKRILLAAMLLCLGAPAWAQCNYAAIKTEVALAKYNGQTNAQIAATINAATVSQTPSPFTITGGQIYNAIVPSEFTPLTADQKQTVRDIISAAAGGIDVSTGTNARTAFLAVFGAGTTTRANMAALLTVSIPQWQTFCPRLLDFNDVAIAKALP